MDSIGVEGWHETSDYMGVWYIGFIFGTYSFIVNVLLNNIVVVVFLREFLATTADDRRKSALEAEHERLHVNGDLAIKSPLDPLLRDMVYFRDRKELLHMISDLYELIQPVSRFEIGFVDLQHGLRALGIHMNRDDWHRLTDGLLPRGKTTLDRATFSAMMHEQLRLFTSGQIISLMGFTTSINPLGDQADTGMPPIELQRAIKMLADEEELTTTRDRGPEKTGNSGNLVSRRTIRMKDEEIQRLQARVRELEGRDKMLPPLAGARAGAASRKSTQDLDEYETIIGTGEAILVANNGA
jgi:hypothetical protein